MGLGGVQPARVQGRLQRAWRRAPGPKVRGGADRGRSRTALTASAASRRSLGPNHPSGKGGGGRAPLPLARERSSCASFPGSAGGRAASAWQGRPLPAWAPPLCLPAAPSSQTNGRRQEIGRAPGEPRASARRGGGAARPAGAGALGDVLTSRQRRELDASKALFTAGLCLLQS